MGGMKEVWEKGKLPMMTDDKNILASMEKIKKNFDSKRRNRKLSEDGKVEYLAVLHSTTLNMAPSNWRKRVLEDKVMSREWKLAKIALLEDYIGEEATKTAVVAPEDSNIAMARSYQERREQEQGA